MNTQFPKLPRNPTTAGFREMQIYEVVRQAADAWNIPLDHVAKFQEWWDNGRTDQLALTLTHEYQTPLYTFSSEEFGHRFSQFYKQHTSYTIQTTTSAPNVSNLIDIAQYYLANPVITVPHFVITIASQQLYDIAELGESVLVLTNEKECEVKEEQTQKKQTRSLFLEYLKKVQLLVEGLQIISTKSLPDLYISNSITFKFSLDIPVKCRNLILAKRIKIEGIRFMPHQMQVMGGA